MCSSWRGLRRGGAFRVGVTPQLQAAESMTWREKTKDDRVCVVATYRERLPMNLCEYGPFRFRFTAMLFILWLTVVQSRRLCAARLFMVPKRKPDEFKAIGTNPPPPAERPAPPPRPPHAFDTFQPHGSGEIPETVPKLFSGVHPPHMHGCKGPPDHTGVCRLESWPPPHIANFWSEARLEQIEERMKLFTGLDVRDIRPPTARCQHCHTEIVIEDHTVIVEKCPHCETPNPIK